MEVFATALTFITLLAIAGIILINHWMNRLDSKD
jgi:hypothetical protein